MSNINDNKKTNSNSNTVEIFATLKSISPEIIFFPIEQIRASITNLFLMRKILRSVMVLLVIAASAEVSIMLPVMPQISVYLSAIFLAAFGSAPPVAVACSSIFFFFILTYLSVTFINKSYRFYCMKKYGFPSSEMRLTFVDKIVYKNYFNKNIKNNNEKLSKQDWKEIFIAINNRIKHLAERKYKKKASGKTEQARDINTVIYKIKKGYPKSFEHYFEVISVNKALKRVHYHGALKKLYDIDPDNVEDEFLDILESDGISMSGSGIIHSEFNSIRQTNIDKDNRQIERKDSADNEDSNSNETTSYDTQSSYDAPVPNTTSAMELRKNLTKFNFPRGRVPTSRDIDRVSFDSSNDSNSNSNSNSNSSDSLDNSSKEFRQNSSENVVHNYTDSLMELNINKNNRENRDINSSVSTSLESSLSQQEKGSLEQNNTVNYPTSISAVSFAAQDEIILSPYTTFKNSNTSNTLNSSYSRRTNNSLLQDSMQQAKQKSQDKIPLNTSIEHLPLLFRQKLNEIALEKGSILPTIDKERRGKNRKKSMAVDLTLTEEDVKKSSSKLRNKLLV